MAIRYVPFALVASLAGTSALALDLAFPLDCTLGEDCYIQNYMDRDPGPDAQDFTCGPQAYDDHEGTDFALPTYAAMTRGVAVRAAAAGIVLGVRDGMPDIIFSDPAAPRLAGRDCGNGVLVDHGDGWQTQYCHMKKGSIAVATGDAVQAGTALGQVGLSGRTQFPHLHVTVRKDEANVDPFDPDGTLTCGTAAPQLWAAPIAHQPGGIADIGIAAAVPEFDDVLAGLGETADLASNAPALVVWVHLFGARAGDDVQLSISAPDGTPVFRETETLVKTQAQVFRAVGRKLTADGWPAGTYSGEVSLTRGGAEIDRAALQFNVAP
jgi:Peptidase family M23